jgi:hypothetical protein
MPSIEDIALARAAALHEIDTVRVEAARRRRASSSDPTKRKMKKVMDDMDAEEERVSALAVIAMDESEEMKRALETLGRVAMETETESLKLKTIADFLTAASVVADATKKFADALFLDEAQGEETEDA